MDVSNGYTTPFPTNRIVVFARPTVDANSLKFLDDWIDLVVTHELAHVFHLDRSRGWWRAAQYVFGRNPFLFPNLYAPSWLIEGIAVHYETRLTGAGRVAGTDFAMVARSKALEGKTPKLNALSAATPLFPLGSTAYAYGTQVVGQAVNANGGMSATGTSRMRDFIETSSARAIPFLLNGNAKAAFGITFDSAYHRWSDSVSRSALLVANSAPGGLKDLTTTGWYSERIRWTDPRRIIYANADGRDVTALRAVDVGTGVSRWVSRRNSLDITSPATRGAMVYSQQEFIDPYTIRNDLWLVHGAMDPAGAREGSTVRLTRGERLLQPDARVRDESSPARWYDIVAVQLVPGAARLVRVRYHGAAPATSPLATVITPLTGASPDTVWSEPRWSHAGTRIAATRWMFGGMSEIVVLDTLGRVQRVVARSRAVNGAPSWAHADSAILFTSDRNGRSAIYRAWLATGRLELLAEAATGLVESEQSPDGQTLATLHYKADGYHVAVMPLSTLDARPADSTSVLPPSQGDPVRLSDAPVTRYSPWRSLLPRYWLPSIEPNDKDRNQYGLITTGRDVVGRHEYQVRVLFEPYHGETSADLTYTYAGLGNPLVTVGGLEEWDHPLVVVDTMDKQIGIIARRKRFASLALTARRNRVRTSMYLSAGAQLEWRDFNTYPSYLLAGVDSTLGRRYTYPTFFVGTGFSNVRYPALAISYEDGIQVAGTASTRWRSDQQTRSRSTSVVGTMSAYKSLPFPGFAHHVLALRVAAAWEDDKATNEFKAGGTSGSILNIAPGVTIGDGRRTFPVRGFPASAQVGTHALGGTLEYRLPIALPAAGYKMLPVFFQRVSASVFGDAATAWCPGVNATATLLCPAKGYPAEWMGSVGAELHLDAAYQYDVPYRFRLGAAAPVTGRKYFGEGSVEVYFAVGLAF